jgi:tetratricopeptide (TPR) repeat protein
MKKWNPIKTLSGIALLIILVAAANLQAAEEYCGDLSGAGQYGPYDYTNPTHRKEYLPIVEGGHFDSGVKNLIKGMTGSIGGDISYTLHAFPNHHQALNSNSKLNLTRDKRAERPGDQRSTAECYFDRAIRFKPGDAIVRMLYANYLLKMGGRRADALEQYQIALGLTPKNANIHYNLGLLYLKEKNYEEATEHAKKAYGLGFPLAGLRNKLMKIGKWDGKLDEEVRDETAGNVDEEIGIESQK